MDPLKRNVENIEELLQVVHDVIERMEDLDDEIFQRSQKLDPYSEENAKLQTLNTSVNSCVAIFTYIEQYEASKKTDLDFLKAKVNVRKLIKVLMDVRRIFKRTFHTPTTSIYS